MSQTECIKQSRRRWALALGFCGWIGWGWGCNGIRRQWVGVGLAMGLGFVRHFLQNPSSPTSSSISGHWGQWGEGGGQGCEPKVEINALSPLFLFEINSLSQCLGSLGWPRGWARRGRGEGKAGGQKCKCLVKYPPSPRHNRPPMDLNSSMEWQSKRSTPPNEHTWAHTAHGDSY